MGVFYILFGSNLEKYGKFRKNGRFSGPIWPDWGNTTRAHLAGLGSIGLNMFNILPTTESAERNRPIPIRRLYFTLVGTGLKAGLQ